MLVLKLVDEMIKLKTFKDNNSYFKFINKKKEVIKIISVVAGKDKIKLNYDDRKMVNRNASRRRSAIQRES